MTFVSSSSAEKLGITRGPKIHVIAKLKDFEFSPSNIDQWKITCSRRVSAVFTVNPLPFRIYPSIFIPKLEFYSPNLQF